MKARRLPCPGDGGFVYFVSSPESGGLLKIGMTQDPRGVLTRLRSLQCQCPVALVCEAAIGCVDVADLRATELALHVTFERDRKHGEWFARTDSIDIAIGLTLRTFGPLSGNQQIPTNIGAVRAVEDGRAQVRQEWEGLVAKFTRRHEDMLDVRRPIGWDETDPPYEFRPHAQWCGPGIEFVGALAKRLSKEPALWQR